MPSLVVNYLPPSVNQRGSTHWRRIAQQRKDAHQHAWTAWHEAGKPLANNRKAVVDIHIEAHGLADDPDNRTSRVKGLLDGLVKVGCLVDDSPEWLELHIPTRSKGIKGKPRITIHIHYIEEETAA